jgi:uncharacterized protein
MVINVRVVANAKKEVIIKDDASYRAYLNAPAIEGKANKALVKLLARSFAVSKSKIEIIRGLKSRDKVVRVDD